MKSAQKSWANMYLLMEEKVFEWDGPASQLLRNVGNVMKGVMDVEHQG